MGKTNTRSQTRKKPNYPQNRNQYSSSRTEVSRRRKKIYPIEGKINTFANILTQIEKVCNGLSDLSALDQAILFLSCIFYKTVYWLVVIRI